MKTKLICVCAAAALTLCSGISAGAIETRSYVDSYLASGSSNGTENPYYGPVTVTNVIEDTVEYVPYDLAGFKPYIASSTDQELKNIFEYSTESVTKMPWIPLYFRMRASSINDAICVTAQSPCKVSLDTSSGTNAYVYKLSEGITALTGLSDKNLKNYKVGKNEYVYNSTANLITPSSGGSVTLDEGTYLVSNCPGEFTQTPANPYSYSYILNVQAPISVQVKGKMLSFDNQPPMIKNGRTLVPVRAIFEEIGASVEWDDSTKTVTAKKGADTIRMTINDRALKKNDSTVMLEVPAQIIGGRTMVPARAVAEAFDMRVTWDGRTKTVIVAEKTK